MLSASSTYELIKFPHILHIYKLFADNQVVSIKQRKKTKYNGIIFFILIVPIVSANMNQKNYVNVSIIVKRTIFLFWASAIIFINGIYQEYRRNLRVHK